MSVNRPVLPLANALGVTLVTLLGLALAFSPGRLAAQAPAELAILTLDGFGLMLIALLIGQSQRLLEAVGVMYELKYKAVALMKIPSGRDDGTTVGPSFEYISE